MGSGSKFAMYLGLKRDPEAPPLSRDDRIFAVYAFTSCVIAWVVATAVGRSIGGLGWALDFGIWLVVMVVVQVLLLFVGVKVAEMWRRAKR